MAGSFAPLSLSASTSSVTPVRSPLSGEEFFVSEKLLQAYAEAAESFFGEIAHHFSAHRSDYY
jgi:hypothetical protein